MLGTHMSVFGWCFWLAMLLALHLLLCCQAWSPAPDPYACIILPLPRTSAGPTSGREEPCRGAAERGGGAHQQAERAQLAAQRAV